MRKTMFVTAVAAAVLPSMACAQNVGEWVLSQYRNSAQYYPGVVVARSGNSVTVQFDAGATEVRPANLLRRFDWRAGTRLECRFTDGQWYPARITAIGSDGLTLDVLYDDGDRQRTETGRCRVN